MPSLRISASRHLAEPGAAAGGITIGDLVAVYGYAAVLIVPVSFLIEGGGDLSRGLVAARRVVHFLRLEPVLVNSGPPASPPPEPAPLHDPVSGVEVTPGTLTALVSARASESASVVDRLARFTDSSATWGGVRLDQIALSRVRERILVADNEADLFAGRLRDVVGGRQDRSNEAQAAAIDAAATRDIVDSLPEGLDTVIDAQGRNLSGGQRQRVRLVRALLADPEVLMAVEPTSALDAHTEAFVASRLRAIRSGRTTVVTSTSPLLLDQADIVHYLVDGRLVATGRHNELVEKQPGYRALVARGAAEDVDSVAVGATEDVAQVPLPPGAGHDADATRFGVTQEVVP